MIKKNIHPFLATVITFCTCIFILLLYLHGPLDGRFSHFFLPAEKFGIPKALQAHGITDMYKGPEETGWDGQFYYYIANDLIGTPDTLAHIDSDAYRYQRIGLPLLANIVAKLTLRTWVSPLTFYFTNLLIILLATGVAAAFFQRRQFSPYFILFWSLGCGTQLTLLNGLPDAMADGLLIMSVIALLDKRNWLYAVLMSLTALSREAYVLMPACLGFMMLVQQLRQPTFPFWHWLGKVRFHAVACAIFVIWQIYLRLHFHTAPTQQAEHILGLPFASAWQFILEGLRGHHEIVGTGKMAYYEAIGVILFILLLGWSLLSALRLFIKSWRNNPSVDNESCLYLGFSLCFIVLVLMYYCFGRTVMMHYSGYFKAANLFLFVLPFLTCLRKARPTWYLLAFLCSVLGFFNMVLSYHVYGEPYHPTPPIQYVTQEPACLTHYDATITPLSLEETATQNWLKRIVMRHVTTLYTKVTNVSSAPFAPFLGKGEVNVSYQWIDAASGTVVLDGLRTHLTSSLLPKQSTVVPVYITYPKQAGHYLLKISLVQEGCNWFYLANSRSAFTIPYTFVA